MKSELHFEVHQGNGPYLLLVHGFLSSKAQWQLNIDPLREVCSPVLIDLLGHGHSPSPDDVAKYTPRAYVKYFRDIKKQLDIENWFVCGYSLGAGLTIRYALEHPRDVNGHIFTNSMSAFASRQGTRAIAESGELIKRFEQGGLKMIEQISVHPRFARRLPDSVKTALLRDCERLTPGGVARTIAVTNSEASVRADIGNNQKAALLICGTREKRFQPHLAYIKEVMPHLRVIELNTGHAVNAEDADGFNRAVSEFILAHNT